MDRQEEGEESYMRTHEMREQADNRRRQRENARRR